MAITDASVCRALTALAGTAQDLDVKALGIDLEVWPVEAEAFLQGGQHDIEGSHRYRLGVARYIQPGIVRDPAMIGLEERTELVGDHDVDRHRPVAAAQRVTFDMPVAVTAAAFTQRFDMMAHRFE
jgi:hypothetical protein